MMMLDGQQGETEPTESGIAPASRRAVHLGRGWLWFVGIALSVAVMARYPMLGVACLAMGLRTQSERFGAKGFLLGLGIAVAVLLLWMVRSGVSSVLFAIPLVGVSAAIAALMWKRRAGVTAVSLVIAAAIALTMSVDAISAARAGTDLAEATTSMLMEIARLSAGRGVQAELTLASAEPIMELIWPLTYVLSVAFDALVAGFGSFLGSVKRPVPRDAAPSTVVPVRVPQISRFDAPLWSVGVIALSVLGMGASFADIPGAQLLRTVSVTLFLSVRIIFMVQGFAVALALVNRWRIGCVGRVAIIVFALWLEVMFIMSIIGLIDVWANFRKLPREGSRAEAHL